MKKRMLNVAERRDRLTAFLKEQGYETYLNKETNTLYAVLPPEADPMALADAAKEIGLLLWESDPLADMNAAKPPPKRPTIEALLETEDSETYIPRYNFEANIDRRVYKFFAGVPQVVPSRDVPEFERRQSGLDEQRDPTIISRDGNTVEKRVSHGTTDGWDVHYPKGKPSTMEYV